MTFGEEQIVPHIARRLFGSSHRFVIPMRAVRPNGCGKTTLLPCKGSIEINGKPIREMKHREISQPTILI